MRKQSQYIQWECLVEWAANNDLILLHNPKGAASFTSRRWNTGTNPDLTFASAGPDNRLPDRCVLKKFPWSQHRPLLITFAKLMAQAPNEPVKQWNFHKADWNYYSLLTNETYEDFCSTIIKVTKDPSHAVAGTTTYHVVMRSVKVFIAPSWMPPTRKSLAVLLHHCCPILTIEDRNSGMKS